MMAWSVAELEREGCPKVFGCALTVLYALLPLSMQAGTAVIKDIPYAAAFLGWVLLTARRICIRVKRGTPAGGGPVIRF
jgi:hypothetical protein